MTVSPAHTYPMNVLLINPPAFHELMGNNPAIIESERGYNPPLGLLMIAGYLLEKTSHSVTVLDAQVEELTYAALKAKIKAISFDVVGITTMTFTLIDVLKTVTLVKEINPLCNVVLGGPHVNIYPEETIAHDGVDAVVLGEGEIVFARYLDILDGLKNSDGAERGTAISKNTPGLEGLEGVMIKDGGGNIFTTAPPGFIPENILDGLPMPARQLTPYQKYSSLLAKRTPITTLFTSRGCPFLCTFCNRPLLGKHFRALSPERVVAEMENCLELGIHEFLIYDDTFTIRRQRVVDICGLIIEKKLDVGFDIRARVDTLDEELLALLKKAGCRGIHYGIEAGTEKILKVLNKGIKLEKAKEIFDLTKKYKMQTLAYFMLGSPTETREDIDETFRVARWLNPDFIHMTILTPFPSTDIYFQGLKQGVIKKDYWREFAVTVDENFQPPHWDELFSREELDLLIVKGYKGFYSRPLYMLKNLFKIRSWGEFKRKAKAGLKVLFMRKAR